MAVAKVILNGTTLIDTTQKTVTAGSMLNGVTALKNDGTDITGSIASKTSSDLTASGATVTAPAGYYASSASKSVSSGSASTPATSITANPSISVSSGGLITASVSASKSVTPTVSAGYVSSGTAGTVSVSGSNTSQLTTQAAQTIHPSTTDQTIASGKYLTGTQTVKGVLLTNLSADNIKKDVVVKVGDSTDDDCVTSVTGTYEGGGGGPSNLIRFGLFGAYVFCEDGMTWREYVEWDYCVGRWQDDGTVPRWLGIYGNYVGTGYYWKLYYYSGNNRVYVSPDDVIVADIWYDEYYDD